MPKEKYPSATLERIIGDIGDLKTEKECLLIKYGLNWKKYKKIDVTEYLTDLTPQRHDLTDITCFSIDPPGCKDIDDVLHFKRIDEDRFEIGIHIADVSSFIPCGSKLDDEIKDRGESVYFKNGQINMMPDVFSTDLCSLLEGKRRRAFSVIITFNNSLDKLDVRFIKTMIINKKAMTYDEVEKSNDETLKDLYLTGKRLFDSNYHKRISLDANRIYDSHTMVEIFMVMANVEVAKMLVMSTPDMAIIRSHRGVKINETIMEKSDSDELMKAIKIVNTLKMDRANYALYDNNADNQHVGLGEYMYTHFTSPIRRYFDVTVHRILSKCMADNINLSELCDHLNDCHKRIGDAHRDSDRLNKIYEFYWDDPVMSTHGYIVNIRDRMLSIFVPMLDIDIEAKIIPDKVMHLITYVSTDDKFVMVNKQTDDTLEFKLLQKLDIRIIVSKKGPYVRKKLVVEILDPNPISFINN